MGNRSPLTGSSPVTERSKLVWACPGFDGEFRVESACKGLFRTHPHGALRKANDNDGETLVTDKVAA